MSKFREKTTVIIVILTILASIATAIFVYDFYQVLERNERDIEKSTLKDFAIIESNLVSTKLEGYINNLIYASTKLDYNEFNSEKNLDILRELSTYASFDHMGIITLDGTLYSTTGPSAYIKDRKYFIDIIQGKQSITGVKDSRITGNKVFVVAIPVTDSSGTIIGGIQGTVTAEAFESYERERLEIQHNCTYVVDLDGNYIIHSNTHDESWDNNIFFEHIGIKSGNSINELKGFMSEGQSFSQDMVILGTDCIAYFQPIGINNWYTVVSVHDNVIEENIDKLLSTGVFTLLTKVLGTVIIMCGIIIFIIHASDKKEQETEKNLRDRLLSGIVGFMIVDLDEDRILRCSRGGYFQQFIDFPFSQFYNQIISKKVHADYFDLVHNYASPDHLRADFDKGLTDTTISFMAYYINDEDSSWLECERHLFKDSNTGNLVVSYVLTDITERKLDEFILKTKAERDLLTGLYNRSAGTGIIGQYLLSHKTGNETNAFIIVDLDNFKTLNDSLGHQTGDTALKDVANILNDFFRKEDIVCRLGGDEFIVFVKHINSDIVIAKAKALIDKLQLTYTDKDGNNSVKISASIGIAMAPDHGNTFDELYKRADLMLYDVKESGKSSYKMYNGQ